jgi:hypothetical protein
MSSNHVPKNNQIEISTFPGPKIAPKVGLFSQLQGKYLDSTLALTQWSSNFFARGTLKVRIFLVAHPNM